MAKTAKLTGILGLNISLFEAGLKKATGAANKFANNLGGKVLKEAITGPLGAIGAAIAGAFAFRSFVGGIKGAITAGAAMKTLSEQTGVSVGALKTLGYAFKEAYADSDLLVPSIGKMQKTLFDASKGSAVAQNALGLLHFQVKDILNLAPEEQFRAIGSAIDSIQDPATKAGAAMGIFGRQGRELIPVFANLKNLDFEELHENAKVLQDNATAFREIAVAANRAFGAMKGVYLGIAAALVPALQSLISILPKISFVSIGKSIGEGLANAYFFVKGFVTHFRESVAVMQDFLETAFAAGFAMVSAYGSDFVDDLADKVKSTFTASFWDDIWGTMSDSFRRENHHIIDGIDEIRHDFERMADSANKIFGFVDRLGHTLQGEKVFNENDNKNGSDWREHQNMIEFTKGAAEMASLVKKPKNGPLEGLKLSAAAEAQIRASAMMREAAAKFSDGVNKIVALGGKGQHPTTRRSLGAKWWNESTGRTLQTGSLQGATMAGGFKDVEGPLAPGRKRGSALNLPSGQRDLDRGAFGHTALVGQRQILDATNSAIASGESRPNHMVRRGDAKRAEDFARSEQKRLMDVGKSIEAGNSILGNISSLLQTSLQ